ncbi:MULTISPECIES: type VI secretion system lipoprotein TssJ [Variovorax]|uniref:type VI secretion system lipoprotein TssJ n=1 Tax=Variovorax TaxID=34072 RepID=UPI00085BE828|nr:MULTISPECIES: type VI secretion system lipoprotein TssJ [Variovorax]OEZ27128.1 type VI secretion protein [Variovorax boronicumulans]TSD57173.1 type VI secretion system lipoprotein TssJ [Variovorax sp. KBS0712]
MRTLGTHHSSYEGLLAVASRRRIAALGLAAAGLLMAGCASKPVVTPVSITLTAGADANPDARGRASPLTVRVYALKTPGPFEGADFFSLFEKDQATLGAELVQREEMLLRPGESKKLDLTLPADAKAIGVMAAFRDLDRARWREVRAVTPGQAQVLNVTFGARQIRVDAAAK